MPNSKRLLVPLVATIMSLAALGSMPYGYYILLRSSFSGICVYYLQVGNPALSYGQRAALCALATGYWLVNSVAPV